MAASEYRHYAVESVDDGIHAAIARPDGYAVCNSGLVDLGEAALVFDTSLTPESARELRVAVERTLGRPPSLAVNSHWHLDHSLGNREFSTVPIWATRRTREIALENREALTAELTREAIQRDLQALEGRRGEMHSEGSLFDIEFYLQIHRALLSAAGDLRITPADRTFETRLDLPGPRGAQLVSFGSGHTEADAVLFLPHERVLFAGDLVVAGVQPSMGSGDPEHWLVVLDEVERLGAEQIVPGHGPTRGTDALEEIRGYLSGILEAATARVGAPLPVALRRWEGSLSFEENLRFARDWLATRDGRG
ncbi:MAG: MBL fold metallo-hydrolase [Thermoplasmata archaeon]